MPEVTTKCARCDQSIEKGQLYHSAWRFEYTEFESMQSGHLDPGVWVHDYPCPQRLEGE